MQIVKFSSGNRQVLLKKSSNFFAKTIKFSYKNLQNFPMQIVKIPLEIVKFYWKIRQIFLQKFSDHLAQIVKFSSKNR